MQYLVRRAAVKPQLIGDWAGDPWMDAETAKIDKFHPQSSDHRPKAAVKMLFDDDGLYVIFRVSDRYVVSKRTKHQEMVCRDSCVEAFLQPRADGGYFNFEVNCGGAMLLYYVADVTKTPKGMAKYEPVSPALMDSIRIYHSMPDETPREIDSPTTWTIEYFVPNAVFEAYTGKLDLAAERRWRGNFYKCADESSHPHWASWSPIGNELNFHVPQYFAPIMFE